jgi:uncharacterized protein YjbJ (UPF0337 family)
MKGSQEELEGALQTKYGYTKEEAAEHVRAFMDEEEPENKGD